MRGSQQAELSVSPRSKAVIRRRSPQALTDFRSGGVAAIWPLTGLTLAAWLALSGALLATRAALGAIQPLSWRQLIVAVAGLLAAAFISHAAAAQPTVARPSGEVTRSKSVLICHALTSGGLSLWAITLLLVAGSRPLAGALCLTLIAAEAWAWRNFAARQQTRRAAAPNPPNAPAPQLVQQFTRTLTAAGEEVIEGRVAVRLEPGSRLAAAHVAFCPPFVERPRFDAQLVENSGGTLKVTQLYAHGARIEVRLPRVTDHGAAFLVRFTARASQFLTSSSVDHKLGSSR